MNFNLEIPNPCSENWNDMTDVENGKHCKTCQKDLIDFRSLSTKDIYNKVNTERNVCGLFTKQQLESNYHLPKPHSFSKLGLVVSFTSLLTFINPVNAGTIPSIKNNEVINLNKLVSEKLVQNNEVSDTIIIKGKINDSGSYEPLPFVNVYLKNNKLIGAITDMAGEFEMKIPKAMFKDSLSLIVSYIGYAKSEVSINPITQSLSILLEEEIDLIGEIMIIYRPTKRQKFFDFFRRKKNKKYNYKCH